MKDLKCYLCGNSKLVALKVNDEARGVEVELICTDCGYVVYHLTGRVEIDTVQTIPPKKYLKPIKDVPTLNKLKRAEERIEAMSKYQDELHQIIRDLKAKAKNEEDLLK